MSQWGLVLGVQGNELPDKSIFTALSTQAVGWAIINFTFFGTGESFRRRRQAYCPGIYADKKGKDGSCLPCYPAVPKWLQVIRLPCAEATIHLQSQLLPETGAQCICRIWLQIHHWHLKQRHQLSSRLSFCFNFEL